MTTEQQLTAAPAEALQSESDAKREHMRRHLDLLYRGILNARAGRREPARDLFLEAIEVNDEQEVTWLWLASVARDQLEIRHCMERVLGINPRSQRAIDWLRGAGALETCRENIRRREEAEATALAEAEPTAAVPEKASTPLILAIDDSPTVRKLVSITLIRHGYRVETAADGMEALARIQETIPDLILLDIGMPHLDGYQICKLIKANARTEPVPVVMLSGKDGFIDKVRGRMAGAIDYITKPIDPNLLIQRLDKILIGVEPLAGSVPAARAGEQTFGIHVSRGR